MIDLLDADDSDVGLNPIVIAILMATASYQTFTEAGSYHFNIVSLSPEHRNTQIDRATKPIIHRSYQGDTRQ